MCHSDDSVPPVPPDAVTPASTTEFVLEASDGNRFAAYAARAAQPTGAGVVVMPDIRGLHEFYKRLAEHFAGIGVDAVAIDYFGRTAGIGDRSEAFEYRPHVEQTTPEGVAADVAAGVAYLRSPDGGGVTSVFTVGFCFGGAYSWRQSADTPGLAGVVGFYGFPQRVTDAVDRLSAPMLMLDAGADPNISTDDVRQLAADARARGVDADVVVYDGAPHSFFDRSYAEHRDACADAWQRIRTFIGTH